MAQDLGSALEHAGGAGQKSEGIAINTFLASLATAIVIFAVEFLLFLLLKSKLTRIYQPRTYLVPDRERTEPSPPGLFRWIVPVFRTSSTEFIQKCGLDAYFFLRYLRMLLKIFVPLGCIILPVLLPLNKAGGKDQHYKNGTETGGTWNVTGLDQLAWGNVTPENTSRYWGHLIMAIITIVYVCAVFYDELRNYIRLRQAYLTSPQHRLRASATTVLVTAIPERWLTLDALDSLFDVFPGGVRNIWINRNFDDLNEKVKLRDALALKLEAAETDLVIKCKKAQLKQAKAEAKKSGVKARKTAKEEQQDTDRKASLMAMDAGISSGDPHQAHTLAQVLHHDGSEDHTAPGKRRRLNPFDPAKEAAGAVGHGVGKLGKSVLEGFKKVEGGIDGKLARSGGFVPDASITHRDGSRSLDYPRSESDSVDVADCSQARTNGTTSGVPDAAGSKSKRPFWKSTGSSNSKLSHRSEPDEFPLTQRESSSIDGERNDAPIEEEKSERDKRRTRTEGEQLEGEEYPVAYNEDFDNEDFGEPLWKKYIRPKDRDTMRLPIFGLSWMPSLPLIGKKVDTIDYCRKEVARLNLEIEVDQQTPEKFPLMNSAFIQFNHQVAAHMACQAVSHHVPKQMAPRIVEISPDDVIWDNMSIRWWERYLRTFGIMAIVCAMVVGWAFPVAFTGLLSQLSYLEEAFTWLKWISKLPEWVISAVQGILPALFLAILMAVLPLILRFLCRTQGVHTGMAVELTVQNYYFAFLFVQLFLVVAISSSFSTIISNVTNVTSWPQLLAENIPLSSNYFFSYMILQAMSVSAGALVQVVNLVSWFILGPLLDTTARTKWARTTNLNQMQWGTFFPVYTTLASIGLIYCVISPLILVFNVITFGLFWFVYRYNTLYVTKFRFDTGGLLFPKAINQLFTGIYFMEVCLIGLFFLVRDVQGTVACKGQAICMIVVLILTVGYQLLLNDAFGPLIRYLPITLEDEAVRRDEEFERAQRVRLGLLQDDELNSDKGQQSGHEEHRGRQTDRATHDIELKDIEASMERGTEAQARRPSLGPKRQSWADRSSRGRSKYFGANSDSSVPTVQQIREKVAEDAEAQGAPTNQVGPALFAGIHDELEDLTPEERDQLVQRAFQHDALRAKRPVIWIPRDDLGVSDDEVYRTQRFSKHIWISNEYQALDGKCRTIFSRSPPDFSEVDLIQL
ncbi:hypothetical protein BDV35DRAFT_347459 [Aspergillus flavus]|uniref:DUF221 domain protein n=5 Tax=Aspergillus subgen. Circumdati TaxID=2720871 RepID=A0A1S9DDK4_ASPOZ|nr:hypothetical protein Ao3042_04955 [Aspergillus oryzae 3.042]KAB8248511.1 hypothetical protein BDV35DRAFT_347459 [Aspergillus flavus]KDE82480.1 hypothetical protein AO1008_08923 [Aspergillus oryzae 100-8]OOO07181.1 protein of unknown function DUF221 [Aspergillus oryzae]KAJ1710316.1 DUF221 domain protein [Aspergillus flavus]|eukprot:EIT78590.1 hypothetical protein Ao3042_04955 [Aspergillus oryzae 3.042]